MKHFYYFAARYQLPVLQYITYSFNLDDGFTLRGLLSFCSKTDISQSLLQNTKKSD